jgi:hypothetical protein
MKKGQFSMEFIMIFALVFFVFVLIIGLIVAYSGNQKTRISQQGLEMIAKTVTDSITLAATSGTDFQTKITLPATLDSALYNIWIVDKDTLVIASGDARLERKLPMTEGSIIIGCNKITKQSGVVSIGTC